MGTRMLERDRCFATRRSLQSLRLLTLLLRTCSRAKLHRRVQQVWPSFSLRDFPFRNFFLQHSSLFCTHRAASCRQHIPPAQIHICESLRRSHRLRTVPPLSHNLLPTQNPNYSIATPAFHLLTPPSPFAAASRRCSSLRLLVLARSKAKRVQKPKPHAFKNPSQMRAEARHRSRLFPNTREFL